MFAVVSLAVAVHFAIRSSLFGVRYSSLVSGSQLAAARDDPLVGGEVAQAHGSAGVEFVGRDADLGSEAVFPPVRASQLPLTRASQSCARGSLRAEERGSQVMRAVRLSSCGAA